MFMVPTAATNFVKTSVLQPAIEAAVALFTTFFLLAKYLDHQLRDMCSIRLGMLIGYCCLVIAS